MPQLEDAFAQHDQARRAAFLAIAEWCEQVMSQVRAFQSRRLLSIDPEGLLHSLNVILHDSVEKAVQYQDGVPEVDGEDDG
jgi:hypothetical protein